MKGRKNLCISITEEKDEIEDKLSEIESISNSIILRTYQRSPRSLIQTMNIWCERLNSIPLLKRILNFMEGQSNLIDYSFNFITKYRSLSIINKSVIFSPKTFGYPHATTKQEGPALPYKNQIARSVSPMVACTTPSL